jgi:YD repeat-containing protein
VQCAGALLGIFGSSTSAAALWDSSPVACQYTINSSARQGVPLGPPAFDTTGTYPATMEVSMSTDIAGATIFYTYSDSGYVPPTHDGPSLTGSTLVYSQPIIVNPGTVGFFGAVVYVNGVGDSDVSQFTADNSASGAMAAADPGDIDLLLSLPTLAVDPSVDTSSTGVGTGTTGTSTVGSQRNVTYNLDKAGNRLSVVDNGATKNYAPNNLNQYTAVQGSTVTNGSEHELFSYQGISYKYINDERLRKVTAGNNSYQLAYDALGRCVKRTVNNATNYYIYDGEKAILNYNSGGAIVARNLYGRGIDEILMRTDNVLHQTYYFQQDHEGSVTHLTDGTGTVTEKYKYDGRSTFRNEHRSLTGGIARTGDDYR